MSVNVVANPVTLSWANFRVVDSSPDLSGDEVAQIHPEMRMPPNIRTAPVNGTYTLNSFTITVAPVPADTIVLRSAAQTPELLRHEQGHYDLLILVARAMARELGAASDATSAGLNLKVQNIQRVHATRATAIDAAYDAQTNHGQDAAAQTGWNMAIAAALGNPASTTIQGMQL